MILEGFKSVFIGLFSGEDAYLESALQDLPELLSLDIARIVNLQVPSLGHDLLGRERSLGISPPGVGPPLFDSGNLVQKEFLLRIGVTVGIRHTVDSHDCLEEWREKQRPKEKVVWLTSPWVGLKYWLID